MDCRFALEKGDQGCNLAMGSVSVSEINKFPLISVTTVCFNAAQFIEQTMKSVLSQTYPNIEYIIIDGGSTDGTVEILRKYEARLAYWHSKSDRGQAHAFNLGLAQTHGQWIVFLNADDYFVNSSVIEKIVPYLIEYHDIDVICGKRIMVTRSKDPQIMPMFNIFKGCLSWQHLRRYPCIPHPAAFTNRKYFDRVGNFNETFRRTMDYEHYLRGGGELTMQQVPIEVSAMRHGGVSRESIIKTWNETRQVQQQTKALPDCFAWLNFFWMIGYFYSCQLAHKVIHLSVQSNKLPRKR